jgi:hypothetical protein
MSRLVFDWRDEDPGALIVLVLALVAVLFFPWQCSLTDSIDVERTPAVRVQDQVIPMVGHPPP